MLILTVHPADRRATSGGAGGRATVARRTTHSACCASYPGEWVESTGWCDGKAGPFHVPPRRLGWHWVLIVGAGSAYERQILGAVGAGNGADELRPFGQLQVWRLDRGQHSFAGDERFQRNRGGAHGFGEGIVESDDGREPARR